MTENINNKNNNLTNQTFDFEHACLENESTIENVGRNWTVSIAVPSSIADNAQSAELRSYLVGQIARSLVIFNVDEIVVYDEFCIPGFVVIINNLLKL